jgi:NhaP-type Na+/H+ or K+/H+ antiporter
VEELLFFSAILVFAFGLFSRLADKSPITAPMVFVGVGLLAGPLCLHLFDAKIDSKLVEIIAEVTLMLILFTDASTIDLRSLVHEYKVPLRLLGIGLPLTMVLGIFVALPLFGEMSIWLIALMAFILSPTDAALGQAVVNSDKVPGDVRDAIGVESGLNDGIALPPIMACMAALSATAGTQLDVGYWAGFAVKQIAFGPVAGALVGLLGGTLMERSVRHRWMNPTFQRLASVSLAILSYSVAEMLGGNGFIAAFFGGLMLGVRTRSVRERLQEFGEAEGQQLCLFVFLIFGMVMVPAVTEYWDGKALLYAILSLTVVRMLPVAISLAGTKMDLPTIGFIGWFGPRGIASVLYMLILIGEIGSKGHERMLSVIVLTVMISVFIHGLSAVPLSGLYGRYAGKGSDKAG